VRHEGENWVRVLTQVVYIFGGALPNTEDPDDGRVCAKLRHQLGLQQEAFRIGGLI
jgi:hypothetical protein